MHCFKSKQLQSECWCMVYRIKALTCQQCGSLTYQLILGKWTSATNSLSGGCWTFLVWAFRSRHILTSSLILCHSKYSYLLTYLSWYHNDNNDDDADLSRYSNNCVCILGKYLDRQFFILAALFWLQAIQWLQFVESFWTNSICFHWTCHKTCHHRSSQNNVYVSC